MGLYTVLAFCLHEGGNECAMIWIHLWVRYEINMVFRDNPILIWLYNEPMLKLTEGTEELLN